ATRLLRLSLSSVSRLRYSQKMLQRTIWRPFALRPSFCSTACARSRPFTRITRHLSTRSNGPRCAANRGTSGKCCRPGQMLDPQGWLSILRGSPCPGGWQALCHLWPPDRTSSQDSILVADPRIAEVLVHIEPTLETRN